MYRTIVPLTLSAVISAAPALADQTSFDVSGFTRVDAGAGLEVEIVAGGDFAVTAEGAARDLKRLEVDKRGDTLVLRQTTRGIERFSPLLWATRDNVVVRVGLPRLDAVEASSGSDVSASGTATAHFEGAASSGASLDLIGIDSEKVTLASTSGAKLSAVGTCGTLDVSASSGAGIAAKDLSCMSAEADASSGANVVLTAREVTAKASSGANIAVWGSTKVESEQSSGGDVWVRE